MKYNIISIPRSGSGYLRSLIAKNLETNDGFYSISEPFNPTKNRTITPNEIIHKMISSDVVVTKNHINELMSISDHNDFWSIPFIHVVLLRRNIFECTLSRCVAIHTKQWSEYKYTANDRFMIPQELFVSEFHNSISMWNAVSTNKFNISYDRVLYYEDLTFKSDVDCSLFGIKYNGKDVNYEKSPDKLSVVSNYSLLQDVSLRILNTLSIPNVLKDSVNLLLDLK